MPDLTPSFELLQKLGLAKPPPSKVPSNEVIQANDISSRQLQANDPTWKKVIRAGVGGLAGIAGGLIGTDPSEDIKNRIFNGTASPTEKANYFSNFGTQALTSGVLDAGLPFASIMKGKSVMHGAPRAFETFNPSLYDKSDVLGWLTHFAESPEYADTYARGAKNWASNSNIIAAKPDAKNVLDLVNPNMDDLSQVIASFPKNDPYRSDLINTFKDARKNPEEYRQYVNPSHYPNRSEIPANEIPALTLSEVLKLKEGDLEKTPFDAIRYNDMNNKSWAIPESTPINTPWGTPMNNPPRSLKVTRLPESYTNTPDLHVSNSRMKPYDSLSAKEKADYLYEQVKSNNGNFNNKDPYTSSTIPPTKSNLNLWNKLSDAPDSYIDPKYATINTHNIDMSPDDAIKELEMNELGNYDAINSHWTNQKSEPDYSKYTVHTQHGSKFSGDAFHKNIVPWHKDLGEFLDQANEKPNYWPGYHVTDENGKVVFDSMSDVDKAKYELNTSSVVAK